MNSNDSNKFSKEDAYRVLELTNSWISNVDTKASLGLAFVVGLLSIIFYNAGNIPQTVQILITSIRENVFCYCMVFGVVLVVLLYLLCMFSIIMFFLAIRGRTKISISKKSVSFFGTVATISLEEYKSKTTNMSDKDHIEDILEQIHINSRICAIKFKFYNIGLWLLLASVILFFICMALNLI